MKQGWHSVKRSDPCKICDGPDNCTESDDGRYAYCGRVSEGSTGRQNAGGQWLHILDDAIASSNWLTNNPRPQGLTNAKPKESAPARDWGQAARAAFNSPNADLARRELAAKWGQRISVASLERLEIGYGGKAKGHSIPERNAFGDVIGINWRRSNGDKRREKDCQAGLTFDPLHWLECDSDIRDVFLVEGASDCAAMLSMGLCAIGRPSNSGGVELLGELLKQVTADRRIVIIGENDRKPHDTLPAARRSQHKPDCEHCSVCWPGWFGATKTAERLAAILNREISATMTPDGRKDVRDWLNNFEETAEN